MDSAWQSVSKITLDLPWQPARAGRHEEERESKGGGERGEGKREGGGVKPKDGKGGKDTQDGKGGKDHHSSLPSCSRPQQAEFITPVHYLRSRSRTAAPRNAPR